MSLWPDEYPLKPPPVLRSTSCCAEEVPGEAPWGMVHVLGHSRVPFTPTSVAKASGVDLPRVRRVIARAVEQGWIGPVIAETYETNPPENYIGHLRKRR